MRSEELCIELILWLCGGSRLGSLCGGSWILLPLRGNKRLRERYTKAVRKQQV